MTAGDIKGDDAIVIPLTAGAVIAKGDLVHEENDDGKWDPAVPADTGPFAVAIEAAAADTDTFRAVIWGPVEVKYGGTNDAKVGNALQPASIGQAAGYDGSAAGQVTHATGSTTGTICGIALELMDTSASTYTMFVGMGGV